MALRGFSADGTWNQEPGFRWSALSVPQSGHTGFSRLPGTTTGILFTNRLAEFRSITNRVLLSGSGVAAGDVDGDGLCDLYFCGLDADNVLYRNLGNWKFEDITAQAGVACPNLDATGAVFADVDGDGDLDLLVTTLGGGLKIFLNDGHGKFKEVTDEAGVTSKSGSMSMALGDVNGDGTLDLYVANYRPTTLMDRPMTQFELKMVDGRAIVALVDGQPATLPVYTNRFVVTPSGKVLELGEPDVLYLNDGKGHFQAMSFTDGSFLDEDGKPLTDPPRDWSLSVQMHDLNGDGAPEIYVCSDLFTPDRLWINRGEGKFQAMPRLGLRHTSQFSMGVDFADIDRDGTVDFLVVDMFSRSHLKRQVQVAEASRMHWPVGVIENRPQFNRNTLQLNRGDGTFAEIGQFAGVPASEWSWCPVFLDVDLDGYEDILISNGQWGDFQNADIAAQVEKLRATRRLNATELWNLMKLYPRLEAENLLYRNRGDYTFEEVGAAWGFNALGISQGMCLADLDNDGDLDVVMNNLNGQAGVFRNESVAPRVAVRLKGLAPNTQGIGARIKVLGGPVPMQSQEVICGGRYLSGDEPMRVFAAGRLTNEITIEVTWRSGRQSVIKGVKGNRLYEIDESGAVAAPGSSLTTAPKQPLFEDVSSLLNHTHADEAFDDFERQPLLPNALSQLGPGVSWFDVDGDGKEDLLIGSGRGGNLALFLNDGKGGFRKPDSELWTRQIVTRDQTTILGVAKDQVLAGSSNYEDGLARGGAVKLYNAETRSVVDAVGGQASSAGPLALAEVEREAALDLFVGGRTIPGRYPEPATSLLLKNENGKFTLRQKFEKLGLVSGAVFSDLDGDGIPELILACEWGPVRVFRKEGATFKEITAQLALDDYTGWWAGVTTGDLDGDGRLDIIASNWGLNSSYSASREHPRKIYFGDLIGRGSVDIVEADYDPETQKEVPGRGLKAVAEALPFLTQKWTSFEAYGRASLQEIYGEQLGKMASLQATTFQSMVFFNRGDHFEPVPLPNIAQFSAAFGVAVADFDGDGNEDVLLAQNFFAVNPDNTRCDAGRGLLLRGDGRGKLVPIDGQESGIKVYGEQRGCAVCDYDEDGRVDIAVTQNGNATKLYHNVRGKPGLRIRLRGPAGNPRGIGAKLRLIANGRKGPVRELHAGSGYWSQDSAVTVMSLAEPATQIEVQWPFAKPFTAALPAGAKEIEIFPSGEIRKLR